jgi:Family of unknown function (DUF5752)
MAEVAEQEAATQSAAGQPEPFRFYTELRLVQLTGRKARTLRQLAGHLRQVPESSVFYHTHESLLQHHFEKPVAHNDFARWVTEALQEDALGERLAFIDLRDFNSLRELRDAILAIIEDHRTRRGKVRPQHAPPGEEFHFCRVKSFMMPNGLVARTVEEFFEILPSISNQSLYFHFVESRLRLGLNTNDFSLWLEGSGEPELARAINALNPYVRTLDELNADIVKLGRKG